MFSATMPPAIERMARNFLRCPSIITVGDLGQAKKDIEQRLEFNGEAKKKKRLEELLVGAEPPIIVFVNQKKAVDVLAKSLDDSGYRVCSIHGGKSQEQREWAMNSFKEGRYDILVATDVTGRGLDIEGVMQVINFDMPKTIEDYTHRLAERVVLATRVWPPRWLRQRTPRSSTTSPSSSSPPTRLCPPSWPRIRPRSSSPARSTNTARRWAPRSRITSCTPRSERMASCRARERSSACAVCRIARAALQRLPSRLWREFVLAHPLPVQSTQKK